MFDLTGKVAIVTGSSRGIGRAIALLLAKQGAKVVVNSSKSSDAADEVVAEITASWRRGHQRHRRRQHPGRCRAADQDGHSIRSDGSTSWSTTPGTTRDTLLMRMSEADWDAVMDLNLKGTFFCTKAAVRPMLRAKAGRIINITSVSGLAGNAGQANYAASKAGLVGFTSRWPESWRRAPSPATPSLQASCPQR